MNQAIITLYDQYTHQPLSREVFLQRLAKLAGGTAAALALLPLLEVNQAHAAITSPNDLFVETVNYPGANGTTMQAYVARPLAANKYPAVVVIHENRGLNAHIEDVARRAANAGFLAIAPNALAPLGGTPPNDDEARSKFQQLKPDESLQNFVNVFDYLANRPDCNGKFGAVGFCWGGAMANNLAVNVPQLKAAVSFYGRQPNADDVPKIKAAVQLHYASLDERINAGATEYETALKANNIPYEIYMYEGVNHAFHNDTAPTRYSEPAAKLAWQRTIEFFGKYLKA